MNKNSFNIPMSYKIDISLLNQLEMFCNAESHSYSSAVRAGLILLFSKRHRESNTRNTNYSSTSSEAEFKF